MKRSKLITDFANKQNESTWLQSPTEGDCVMIWNVMLVLSIVLSIALTVLHLHVNENSTWYFSVFMIVAALALSVCSLIFHGTHSYDVAEYKGSAALIRNYQQQRDTLVPLVQDELSAESFAALMAATPNSNLTILLGTGASEVLLERARTLVALNQKVNDLVNVLTEKQIKLCAYAQNPITPRLFVAPECPSLSTILGPAE